MRVIPHAVRTVLSEPSDAFALHLATGCKTCNGAGGALCSTGMQLLVWFQSVIHDELAKDAWRREAKK